MNISKIVKGILAEVLYYEVKEIKENMYLNSLSFDSYAQRDFISDLKYEYNIKLTEDIFSLNAIKTVKDLINLVKKYNEMIDLLQKQKIK